MNSKSALDLQLRVNISHTRHGMFFVVAGKPSGTCHVARLIAR